MKYKITNHEDGLDIDVSEVKGNKEKLLQAFQECQEGRCTCPTQEYEKVAKFDIDKSREAIHLSIKTKDGEEINKNEIENCLEYTKNRVSTE